MTTGHGSVLDVILSKHRLIYYPLTEYPLPCHPRATTRTGTELVQEIECLRRDTQDNNNETKIILMDRAASKLRTTDGHGHG